MKQYRVIYVNSDTNKEMFKDFLDFNSAMNFISTLGCDNYLIGKYNPAEMKYDLVPYSDILNFK